MTKLTFLTGLFFLLIVGCYKEEGLIVQDQETSFRNDGGKAVERPFKGVISGPTPAPTGPCDFGAAISGTLSGNLTHLGLTRVEYEGCARPFFPDVPRSIPGRFIVEGQYIAPPLDTIIIITDFFSFPDEEDQSRSQLEGGYTVTGGTGRFKDANGRGAIKGSVATDPADPDNMGVTLEFDRTIVY